jgi:hypothetical protein
MSKQQSPYEALLLLDPEQESWRSPLASMPPFKRARWEDTARSSGGRWNRQPLKLQLVFSKRPRLILQSENQTG